MKYIKTKDGVYEVVDKYEVSYVIGYTEDGFEKKVYKEDVIKQADTIEELCDEFIYDYGKDKDRFKNDSLALKILRANNNEKVNIYGAIWTDKGLIYVAKMNEDGVLCLI